MTREEIISALDQGEYEIKYEEKCGCSFGWQIRDGQLEDGCDGEECWTGKALYIGDELIAESIRHDRWIVHIEGLDEDDIDDEIWHKLSLPDMVGRGEIVNQAHHDRMRQSLIDWLMEGDYTLSIEYPRDFANEYSCCLTPVGEGEKAEISGAEAAKWADAYLYDGDAATEAYNDFRLLDRPDVIEQQKKGFDAIRNSADLPEGSVPDAMHGPHDFI